MANTDLYIADKITYLLKIVCQFEPSYNLTNHNPSYYSINFHDDCSLGQTLIDFLGRRLIAHPQFGLILSSTALDPTQLGPIVSSDTTVVDWTPSNQTIFESLLKRCFALLRPSLYQEYRLVEFRIRAYAMQLRKLDDYFKGHVRGSKDGSDAKGSKAELQTGYSDSDVHGLKQFAVNAKEVCRIRCKCYTGVNEMLCWREFVLTFLQRT